MPFFLIYPLLATYGVALVCATPRHIGEGRTVFNVGFVGTDFDAFPVWFVPADVAANYNFTNDTNAKLALVTGGFSSEYMFWHLELLEPSAARALQGMMP